MEESGKWQSQGQEGSSAQSWGSIMGGDPRKGRKKSLPSVSGQTELGRPLLHYSVEVREGRMA